VNIIDLVGSNAWESGADAYIIKAGQGTLEYDWRTHAGRAMAEGKPFGLYWLCDSRYSPEGHKAAIKAAFPDGNFGALGLWLDIEKPRLDMTDDQYRATPYHGYKLVESVWRGVQAYTGIYPGMYFAPGSWDLIMSAAPATLQMEFAAGCECWIAHYTSAAQPSMRGMWPRWAMWQWRAEPDYNRVNPDWWASLDITPDAFEIYIVERNLTFYDLCFTVGTGELPLDDAVSHAAERGWDSAMNGGAGFTYTDADHAIPKTAGFATVQGIPYARRLLTDGAINPNLDTTYKAPWCVLAFHDVIASLIVTVGSEGESGMTQMQVAEYCKARGYAQAYLMDSGRSAQIEEAGKMLYWPYGPAERVPQFIGFKKKITGGNMKGTGKTGTTTNVKNMTTSAIVATIGAGDYVYGTPNAAVPTDLINFDHFYRASGQRVDLGAMCKCVTLNLVLSNDLEAPPPPDPTGNVTLKSWQIVINIDGVDHTFGG
jgi:hypothetical protein